MTNSHIAIHSNESRTTASVLDRRALLTLLMSGTAAALVAPPLRAARAAVTPVLLYRDPGCGCCERYVAYLRQNGFDVTVKSASQTQLSARSRKAGIPAELEGCHTAYVGGYVVDGLVPIAAVRKLLEERPPLKAITLPGMPNGAPGMTTAKTETLTVYAIPQHGKPAVFMTF